MLEERVQGQSTNKCIQHRRIAPNIAISQACPHTHEDDDQVIVNDTTLETLRSAIQQDASVPVKRSRFTNVVAMWPGSVHDSHIMRCSQVCTHLEESHLSVQDGLILGDSGYACRSFLMTPYLRPTEPCHEKFNKAHMKTRCCIERTFGWWKKRFSCLHQGIRMHPEKGL
ncbi:putative nuclease HARBI1 [Mytilus edulis]|uniref:putative nuclease HARBI1 n=1 Tax=Mytilus edulis TaxID=6550 RepID=UPI0039EF89B8